MAIHSSALVVRVACVLAGVVLGGLLGAGAGVLALLVYPADDFPSSSDGILQAFFAVEVFLGYALVGALPGIVAAFSLSWRCLVGLGIGSAVGLIGALGVIVGLPRTLTALVPTNAAGDLFDRGIPITILALLLLIVGAVLGRR
jgi:hypothetical protein